MRWYAFLIVLLSGCHASLLGFSGPLGKKRMSAANDAGDSPWWYYALQPVLETIGTVVIAVYAFQKYRRRDQAKCRKKGTSPYPSGVDASTR